MSAQTTWQFTADVHGAHRRFGKAYDPSKPVVLCGDNLNLVDFHSLKGVATRVLRKRDISRILLSLATHGPKAAKQVANEVFFENPDAMERALVEIRKEYAILADMLPDSAIVLHGNVDWPEPLSEALGDRYLDYGVREIGGVRIGFVSGTGYYPFSMNLPGEATDEIFSEKLWSLGKVDVLCSHFPPAIDDLTWDVVAKRNEGGGKMICDYILETKPKLHLFGHIHNPKQSEGRLGDTRLLNIGGFRAHGGITEIDLQNL